MAMETDPLLQHDAAGPGEQSAASASAAVVEKAPKWERRFANAVFFLLGCTFLLPWNSILVEAPYIAYRVRGSPFTDSYLSFISLVYLISNLGFMALANYTQAKSSPSWRIGYTILAIVALQLVYAFTSLPTSLSPTPFFLAFILPSSVLLAWSSSFLQNAVVALSSLFGQSFVQSQMVGQAVVGIAVSLVQLVTAVGTVAGARKDPSDQDREPAKLRTSSLIFWLVSSGFAIFSGLAFLVLSRTSIYRAIRAMQSEAARSSAADASKAVSARTILVKIRNIGLSIFWTFLVTLAVFPAVTAAILSIHDPAHAPRSSSSKDEAPLWAHPLVFVTIQYLVFSLADYVGREIPRVRLLRVRTEWQLAAVAILRTVCVPLFMACNVVTGGTGRDRTVLFGDVAFMVFLFVFGATNGYVSTVGFMMAVSKPTLAKHEVDTAGTMLAFFLLTGLVFGSLLSFGIRAAVCRCNPLVS